MIVVFNMNKPMLCLTIIIAFALSGCLETSSGPEPGNEDARRESGFVPHTIIGIPDTGINPYHEMYYRPDLTEHPSAYIEGFPSDVQRLSLSVGGTDYGDMFESDQDVWENINEGEWYWIPQTVFVAVYCESGQGAAQRGSYCILDDGDMHGTGTTSSALTENEDALIAFKAGGPHIDPFLEGNIPVDVFSVSWGHIVPIPVGISGFSDETSAPIYVLAGGNDPRSILMDTWTGNPNNIVVGGASAQSDSQEGLAANQPDLVSYFCRPTADTNTVSGMREEYCGTSFAAPTVAGALSKVIYEIRNSTGYTGSVEGEFIDPIAGITIQQLRDAMNLTATYEPEPRYDNSGIVDIPLNPVAPWAQWSWGFYDGAVAERTIGHLNGTAEVPDKPLEAQAYMDAVYLARQTIHG